MTYTCALITIYDQVDGRQYRETSSLGYRGWKTIKIGHRRLGQRDLALFTGLSRSLLKNRVHPMSRSFVLSCVPDSYDGASDIISVLSYIMDDHHLCFNSDI